MYARAKDELGRIDVLFNNAGISPPDDASVLGHVARGVAAGPGRQPQERLPLLQARDPPSADDDPPRRLGDQHGVLRRGDGLGGLADLLHGLEGRRAGALARARRRVRAARRPRQRAVPGPGEHAAAPGAVREATRRRPARRLVHLPMGRFAEAGEIAQAALFLASDESSYVTASTFLVDGGLAGRLPHARVASTHRSHMARPSVVPRADRAPASRHAVPPGRARSAPRPRRCGSR